MELEQQLIPDVSLPRDGCRGTLVGRAWIPGEPGGPEVVAIRPDGVFRLGAAAPTMSDLLDADDPVALVRATPGERLGSVAELLAGSRAGAAGPAVPHLLAPCDLQSVKASGVTFVDSLLERVIEEQARGDAGRAEAIRARVTAILGDDLASVRPGSAEAQRVKEALIADGAWSPYLEVGIGPDAEIFTKAQPLSAVGTGAKIGIHPMSSWNNPEPEVVLAVNSRGRVVGATLGNDVNLRDVEGRSALLLGRAKDNNGSCAIGPFVRLFDEAFGIEDVRRIEVELTVDGPDGYRLTGRSSLSRISRDPLDLVRQTINDNHQYPDGLMLFLGTMFAPTADRDLPGSGFTHRIGDVVTIRAAELGALVNRVDRSDGIPRWTFGARALMRSLAARGLL
jgi:fumarylacetoacetate (FAA) hydrolase family protein